MLYYNISYNMYNSYIYIHQYVLCIYKYYQKPKSLVVWVGET